MPCEEGSLTILTSQKVAPESNSSTNMKSMAATLNLLKQQKLEAF